MNSYKTIEGQDFEIRISYDLGGGRSPRGYYLSVSKVNVRLENGFRVVSQTLSFDGKGYRKMLLSEVKRKSQKQEALAIEKANEYIDTFIQELLNDDKETENA